MDKTTASVSFPLPQGNMYRYFEFLLPQGGRLYVDADGNQIRVWCDIPEDSIRPPTIFDRIISLRATGGLVIAEEE